MVLEIQTGNSWMQGKNLNSGTISSALKVTMKYMRELSIFYFQTLSTFQPLFP